MPMSNYRVMTTIMLVSGHQDRFVSIARVRGYTAAIQDGIAQHKKERTARNIKGRTRIARTEAVAEDRSLQARHDDGAR